MAQRDASQSSSNFTIGIMLYPDFDLLDLAGPYDVFNMFDGSAINRAIQVISIAANAAPVASSGGFALTPTYDFNAAPPIDLLFVPGAGPGIVTTIADDHFLDFLRQAASQSRYVTSVCTGALLLASAGLLDGYEATTHWSCVESLRLFDKVKVVNGCPRYVRDRNRITGGGISSTIDEALFMVETLVADMTGSVDQAATATKRTQLSIQYNPQPTYSGGDPCNAPYSIYEPVVEEMAPFRNAVRQAVIKRIGGEARGAARDASS